MQRFKKPGSPHSQSTPHLVRNFTSGDTTINETGYTEIALMGKILLVGS